MPRITRYTPRIALCAFALIAASCSLPPHTVASTTQVSTPQAALTQPPTEVVSPTLTPAPTITIAPTLTPTPTPSLVQLTEPGCCVQPFWSPDGSHILFLDKPSADAPSGLYQIDPGQPGGTPEFFDARPGLYSADMSLVVYPERGLAVIENRLTGERWEVNTNGNAPAFSLDGRRMVWQVGGGSGPTNARRSDLYLANSDGSEAHYVASFIGGGAQAWFPDSAHLLVVARPSLDSLDRALMVLNLGDGTSQTLASVERIGGVRLSPGGNWVAYTVTFSGNAADDGLWLARTDGSGLRRLDVFGAYQWRDDGRLLVIPLEPGQGSDRVLEVDAASGQARPVTDPAVTPFTIANGDWAVSPDGSRIVFVSAEDRSLWLLQFP